MPYPQAGTAEVEFFREHGWLVVVDAIDPAELSELGERCEVILQKKHKLAFDWAWEKGKEKHERDFKIVQSSASMVWPEIARTQFRRWMVAFASALMQREVEFWYDQYLAKPPRAGAPTYWHQDEGYWGRNLDDRGITCWMPLQDVDERNGCIALHRRRSSQWGARASPAGSHSERPALLRARCLSRAGMSQPFGQCHVPSQQDAAHDAGEPQRRLAARSHDAYAGAGVERRRRPLPLESVREPSDRRAHRSAVALRGRWKRRSATVSPASRPASRPRCGQQGR